MGELTIAERIDRARLALSRVHVKTRDIGRCALCGKGTASGMDTLCAKCADAELADIVRLVGESSPTTPPIGDAPEVGVVAKVRDDNGEATLITIIDDDGDGHLRLIGDGGDVTAEFCTKRGGGQDPTFTAAVRDFIGAVQRSVSARAARHGT